MNAASSEPSAGQMETRREPSWSFQRRGLLVLIVLVAHVGVLFAVSDRRHAKPRPPAPSLAVTRLTDSGELLELSDPTLFALPHYRSFAGQTWLTNPTVGFPQFYWSEPPRLLSLPVEGLGEMFARFQQANTPAPFDFTARTPETMKPFILSETPSLLSARSRLRLAGELQHRRLLASPDLPSWPAADLLTNSVVRALVGADGLVVSPALEAGSGSAEADQFALNQARVARFAPLPAGEKKIGLGVMIFEWQTVPITGTNKPAAEN